MVPRCDVTAGGSKRALGPCPGHALSPPAARSPPRRCRPRGSPSRCRGSGLSAVGLAPPCAQIRAGPLGGEGGAAAVLPRGCPKLAEDLIGHIRTGSGSRNRPPPPWTGSAAPTCFHLVDQRLGRNRRNRADAPRRRKNTKLGWSGSPTSGSSSNSSDSKSTGGRWGRAGGHRNQPDRRPGMVLMRPRALGIGQKQVRQRQRPAPQNSRSPPWSSSTRSRRWIAPIGGRGDVAVAQAKLPAPRLAHARPAAPAKVLEVGKQRPMPFLFRRRGRRCSETPFLRPRRSSRPRQQQRPQSWPRWSHRVGLLPENRSQEGDGKGAIG